MLKSIKVSKIAATNILYMYMDTLFHGLTNKGKTDYLIKVCMKEWKLNSVGKSYVKELNLEYEGEIDSDGQACGFGFGFYLTGNAETDDRTRQGTPNPEDESHSFIGTWLNNRPHGICELLFSSLKIIQVLRKNTKRIVSLSQKVNIEMGNNLESKPVTYAIMANLQLHTMCFKTKNLSLQSK